jgi:YidC/Oxa1 family membrane protein insertase
VVSQKLVIETDVLRVSIDTLGGDVVRAELPHYLSTFTPEITDQLLQTVGLQKKPDFKPEPIVLFDAAESYRAQTGLVGAKGEALPTHHTLFAVASEERVLKDGANELSLRLESAEVGGVKLIKTYTFKRGSYAIGVKHEVVNAGGAPVAPQLYVQLVRAAATQGGNVPFAPTYTGPALYTDKAKFHKLEFKDIEKGKLDFEKSASDGWVAMVQHYFTSAWLHGGDAKREFFANKVAGSTGQTYAVGMLYTLPELAPGATAAHEDTLFAGPQEENKLAALAPGLELVKDYGIFSILSKPLFWLLDKLHGLIGNWGWAIVALVVLLKIAFYWLNASAYRSMAKMKAVAPRINEMRERLKDKPHDKGHDRPAPVAHQAVQLVQQPEERLGQDGEDAVVLHKLQARGQGGELVFFLRASEERVLMRGRCAGRQLGQGVEHAHRIGLAGGARHLVGEELALGVAAMQPGRGEVVLHHGHPAVAGRLFKVQLALLDVLELELVELGLVRVERRAGVGGRKGHIAALRGRRAHQLHIELRRNRRATGVDDFVLDADGVGAALEGVGLDQLDAADLGRLQTQAQLIGAVLEHALFRGHGKQRVVRRQGLALGADQARLGAVALGGIE